MSTDYSSIDALVGVPLIIGCIVVIFNIILFFKIWEACNDIAKIHDRLIEPLDDIRFWSRARYESDKRRGIIIESDVATAEEFVDGTVQK